MCPVIQVENNYKPSVVVAVGAVPRFLIKRGLLQSFCFNFVFFVKTWMKFLFILPFLVLENTFGKGTIDQNSA